MGREAGLLKVRDIERRAHAGDSAILFQMDHRHQDTKHVDDRDRPMSTERLRFGLWHDDDGEGAHRIWGDPEVTRLTGGPLTAKQVAERLAREVGNWRLQRLQYWPVFLADGGRLAGCCGLRPHGADARTAEFGFQFCRDAWGRGYATEAATAVIAWARARGLTALVAGHHPENDASKRVLLRLGFRYTHEEFYPPTRQMEPCYVLPLAPGDGVDAGFR